MNEWNDIDFKTFFDKKSSGLIYFYTPLCGTCQVASRMLLVIEKMMDIDMGKLNLNYHPSLGKQWGIESVPCLFIVHDGEVKETIYAFQSVPFLLEKIKQYMI